MLVRLGLLRCLRCGGVWCPRRRARGLRAGDQQADVQGHREADHALPAVTKQIQQKGASPKLVAEECRIARQLEPRLEDQIAALKQSGCIKDPQVGSMIADIVRGHEDDLARCAAAPPGPSAAERLRRTELSAALPGLGHFR